MPTHIKVTLTVVAEHPDQIITAPLYTFEADVKDGYPIFTRAHRANLIRVIENLPVHEEGA